VGPGVQRCYELGIATGSLLVLARLLARPFDLRRASRDTAVGPVDGASKPPSPLLHPRVFHQLDVDVGADDRLGNAPLGDPPRCLVGWWAAIMLRALLLVTRVLMMAFDFECLFEAWAPFDDTSFPSLPLCSVLLFLSTYPPFYPDLRYTSLICAVFPLPSAFC